jgi:hypothetical protein
MAARSTIISIQRIAARLHVFRGMTVMLDTDLADLYRVTTGNLNKAVKRNARRFPSDFMFQLKSAEHETLLFQIGRANDARGGRRSPPFAFTEQGVAMLSSVLKSDRAADVNVAIMRTFVKLRRMLASNEELARKVAQHDQEIGTLFEHVRALLEPPPQAKKKSIGFAP